MPYSTSSPAPQGRRKVNGWCLVLAALVGLGLGAVFGWVAASHMGSKTQGDDQLLAIGTRLIRDGFSNETVVQDIINTVDARKIQEYLRMIVAHPHVAGTEGDHHLATYIHDQWILQGLEDVQLVPYDVLLSYPDEGRPNTVQLIGTAEDILYQNTLLPLPPKADWTSFTKYPYPYFAYTPNGTVVGDPVFANYGIEEDYAYLTKQGVNVTGKIIIVKHGRQPCDNKMSLAEKHGAIGLLIYADPAEMALLGAAETSVYPHTWWLPNTAFVLTAARGNVGDPLTPGYPSIENVYRIPVDKLSEFHKIPAQPISALDAREILGRMGGQDIPEIWQGSMDIPYRIGPGFSEAFSSIKLKMSVYNQLKTVTSYNVIGTITGEDEPDRYVIMGNHRDAWVKGAVDPGSGTAVMLELTRTLGEIRKNGWRPRRTLMFCSWGAEEFGLIGSTEWVEEHLVKLQERAVSYLNVDVCVAGQESFAPVMSSTLKHAVFKVAKLIPDPVNTEESLYDSWHRNMKKYKLVDQNDTIKSPSLGISSDHAAFLYSGGIPVMDITWQQMEGTGGNIYPAYHTAFETMFYLEKFLDPGYVRHVSCVQFTGSMMHYLADTNLLPLNFKAWVDEELERFEYLTSYDIELEDANISLIPLKRAYRDLSHASAFWESFLEKASKENPYALRSLNDHMMLTHKAVLNRMNVDSTMSWFNRYGTEQSLFSILDIVDEGAQFDKRHVIEQHLSNLLIMVQQLVAMLGKDPYGV